MGRSDCKKASSFLSRYRVVLRTKYYEVIPGATPSGWLHVTIIYHGDGNGLSVYYDGILKDMDTTTTGNGYQAASSNGHMVLGRQRYSHDGNYASAIMDELTLWNN